MASPNNQCRDCGSDIYDDEGCRECTMFGKPVNLGEPKKAKVAPKAPSKTE